MSDWKFYAEVSFSDTKIKQYNVDTRDFHCACHDPKDLKKEIDLKKVLKEPDRFVHSPEEIFDLLTRLFTESGGNKRWRMLILDGEGSFRTENWAFKYIRIHRIEQGLIVCNNQHFVMSKSMLASKVNQEYLHAH